MTPTCRLRHLRGLLNSSTSQRLYSVQRLFHPPLTCKSPFSINAGYLLGCPPSSAASSNEHHAGRCLHFASFNGDAPPRASLSCRNATTFNLTVSLIGGGGFSSLSSSAPTARDRGGAGIRRADANINPMPQARSISRRLLLPLLGQPLKASNRYRLWSPVGPRGLITRHLTLRPVADLRIQGVRQYAIRPHRQNRRLFGQASWSS
jgi:hypothetical protein